MAVDFRDIKKLVKPVVDGFDHSLLNDHKPFQTINPTTENLSKYLFLALADRVAELGGLLIELEVWESDQCGVSYAA